MKNISLRLALLQLLIVSCTTDTVDNDNKISNQKSKKNVRLVQNVNPSNPANIYDFAGKLHNDILNIYLAANYQHTTIAQISQEIEAIALTNNDLMILDVETNLSSDPNLIQEIVNNPQTKLNHVIENSIMTNSAKESLSNFMNDIHVLESTPYEEIYQSIISYESSVINHPEFNNEEKRIILTTSSIIRYSLYFASGRKDEDWGSSIGHRVGGLSGAINNSTTAIMRSLVTGIMINNLVAD
ncbi:hypothetical protein [Flavobacterium hydatis]|uniref:Lipoprotein n=1 Tax=Flavobacterium hydatis TaxID=991 RepID=A0A086AM41_FLAHY|nr:hypothetical protein [Flavobacterium hydatis]KFF17755.1 hypothetical protein IW20_07235 [Flavobacterium hydatis]OXA93710.1 hypothetical protein B0A62_13265 [Flavobacterium hydatis]